MKKRYLFDKIHLHKDNTNKRTQLDALHQMKSILIPPDHKFGDI